MEISPIKGVPLSVPSAYSPKTRSIYLPPNTNTFFFYIRTYCFLFLESESFLNSLANVLGPGRLCTQRLCTCSVARNGYPLSEKIAEPRLTVQVVLRCRYLSILQEPFKRNPYTSPRREPSSQ